MVKDGYKFVLPLVCAGIAAAVVGWHITAAVLWVLSAGIAFFFVTRSGFLPPSRGLWFRRLMAGLWK